MSNFLLKALEFSAKLKRPTPERQDKGMLREHFWEGTTLRGEDVQVHTEKDGCERQQLLSCLSLRTSALLRAVLVRSPDSAELLQYTCTTVQGDSSGTRAPEQIPCT